MDFDFSKERLGTPKEWFYKNLGKLTEHDMIRVASVVEAMQWTILFAFFGFLSGFIMNIFLDDIDAVIDDKSDAVLAGEILLELITLTVVAFFGRLVVKLVPSIWHFQPISGYRPQNLPEQSGELLIAFIHIATGSNLLSKVQLLSKRTGDKLSSTVKNMLGLFVSFDPKPPAPRKEGMTSESPPKRVSFAPDALRPRVQTRGDIPPTVAPVAPQPPSFMGADMPTHPLSHHGALGEDINSVFGGMPLQGGMTGVGLGTQQATPNMDIRNSLQMEGSSGFPDFDGMMQNYV